MPISPYLIRLLTVYQYVGELGWKVVQNNGGWQEMCSNTNVKYINLVKKDLQKQIKVVKKEGRNQKLIL